MTEDRQGDRAQVTKHSASGDEQIARGLLLLETDRERSSHLVARLRSGVTAWNSLSARERQRLVVGPPLIELLLEKSYSLRFEDPETMLSLARAATGIADCLSPRRYGSRIVADLRAGAWLELANAYRIADQLDEAGAAFSRARQLAAAGTHSVSLTARLAELLALYLSDLTRFPESIHLLEQARDSFSDLGRTEAVVRTSISLALVLGYSNEPERAITTLLRVVRFIEPQSPLRLSVIHGLALNLVDAGFCEAARSIIQGNRRLYRRSGRLNQYRLLWLEGKIAAGLRESGRAEASLNTARLAFLRVKQTFDAALVGLDLALLYARAGRHSEVIWLVDEMLRTFRALGIARESIASLLLLRKSCEQRRSVDVLCGQIEALSKLMPELRRQGKKFPEKPTR